MSDKDLRCSHKKHGVITSEGFLEVKCDSRFCGAQRGVVVLHRFSTTTGEELDTHIYRDPNKKGKKA